MSSKMMLLIGAILGAISVTFGAFGAHLLPDFLKAQSLAEEVFARRMDNWDVASQYLMYHALAVVACGLLAHVRPCLALSIEAWFFIVGAAIFSGMLYALVLSGVGALGAIVPLGGLLMIFGWIALAYAGGGYCSRECKVEFPKT